MTKTSGCASGRLIYDLPTILESIKLPDLFSQEQLLEVELGSGDGSFLVEYARQHPERNFIGVERLLGRLRKLERKGRELNNLRGLRIESGYFLKYLIPPGSVSALHIYFPDPWPKRKHRRHRLINQEFPSFAQRSLTPEGIVYLRTDDADYFEQMMTVFGSSSVFQRTETPADLLSLLTDFERDFRARGVQTLHAAYQMRPEQANC